MEKLVEKRKKQNDKKIIDAYHAGTKMQRKSLLLSSLTIKKMNEC